MTLLPLFCSLFSARASNNSLSSSAFTSSSSSPSASALAALCSYNISRRIGSRAPERSQVSKKEGEKEWGTGKVAFGVCGGRAGVTPNNCS
jgi:hypothetical protein